MLFCDETWQMRSCPVTAHAVAWEACSSEAWELSSRDSWGNAGKVSGECWRIDELLSEVGEAEKGMIEIKAVRQWEEVRSGCWDFLGSSLDDLIKRKFTASVSGGKKSHKTTFFLGFLGFGFWVFLFLVVQTFLSVLNLQGPLCQLLFTSKKVNKVPVQSELKDTVFVRFSFFGFGCF